MVVVVLWTKFFETPREECVPFGGENRKNFCLKIALLTTKNNPFLLIALPAKKYFVIIKKFRPRKTQKMNRL